MQHAELKQLMGDVQGIAEAAGQEIMAIFRDESRWALEHKADDSPLTAADLAAHRLILARLTDLTPDIPVISEESEAIPRDVRAQWSRCWMVDPLDGTKEFISKNGEFTVNIALVEHGEPVAGVVYAPALKRIFWGEKGVGAAHGKVDGDVVSAWHPLAVRKLPAEGATVVASRSHRDQATEDFLKTVKVKSLCSAGSSLKFCLIAAAEADLYPRFGRTMEWDTAAGHAVLLAAGGKVVTVEGPVLSYGKRARGYDNPGFIASA